jgi:hypothetical protein
MGCVVVAVRDLGGELEPETRDVRARLGVWAGMATGSAERAMRQPWLAKNGSGEDRGGADDTQNHMP